MNNTETARWASGLNVLAGIWIAISPWVVHFQGVSTATGNDIIVGIAIIVLASIHLNDTDQAWASWVNLVLGIWMIVSSYILGFSMYAGAWGNNILSGIVVAVLSIIALSTPTVASSTYQTLRRRGPTFTGTLPTDAEQRRRDEDLRREKDEPK